MTRLTKDEFKQTIAEQFPTAVVLKDGRGLEITAAPADAQAIHTKAVGLGYVIPEPPHDAHGITVLRVFGFPRRKAQAQ